MLTNTLSHCITLVCSSCSCSHCDLPPSFSHPFAPCPAGIFLLLLLFFFLFTYRSFLSIFLYYLTKHIIKQHHHGLIPRSKCMITSIFVAVSLISINNQEHMLCRFFYPFFLNNIIHCVTFCSLIPSFTMCLDFR